MPATARPTLRDYELLATELYRGVLNREPDPEGLAHHAEALQDGLPLGDLLRAFIASPEFADLHAAAPSEAMIHVSRDPPLQVQVAITPHQAARLWAHVGANWATLGDQDPYWSVLSAPRWRLPNMANPAVLDAFHASGADDLGRIQAWLARHDRSLEGATCIEFGCGVGRVTAWLAPNCRHVHAFDISPTHLQHAKRHLRQTGAANVAFHLVRTPADLAAMPPADLFVSSIVLQHNPPPIIALILGHAFQTLAPDGIALFQVPTHNPTYAFDVEDYLSWAPGSQGIEVHCLPQRHIFAAAAKAGLVPLEVQQDNLAGEHWLSQTFLFHKPAKASLA